MPRSRLGPLAIESKLGDIPSQSFVWRAIHVQLQRAVAVKIFSVTFGGTLEARTQFAEEWERLKKVQHPAIAQCYGGGFEENDAYLAHELIEGETLSMQLERRNRLPWESVLELAEPLADALKYLHGQQIYHGEIQPDKILIAGLSPVLIDVRVNRNGTPYRTGRPPKPEEIALRPPERIGAPNVYSANADLYSLGATMYLALTGRMPVEGETVDEISKNVLEQVPPAPASIVLDCPVWLDKLVMQLLQKNPTARPNGAVAVQMALAEVRRRAMSLTGVAEHASAGFSPLSVTDQDDRDEARMLLGRDLVDLDEIPEPEHSTWHDKPWFLIVSLIALVALLGYLAWPLNEDQLRAKAEKLIDQESRSSLTQAKLRYLEPLIERFPDGRHTVWAKSQIAESEMLEAEHRLQVKLRRNLPLKGEGERRYAEAHAAEEMGDVATALDKYHALVTLLGDDSKYTPYVDLALRQIDGIEGNTEIQGEAADIIRAKLAEAEQELAAGNGVAARKIWYSVVTMYEENRKVAHLVKQAQDRLAHSAPTD